MQLRLLIDESTNALLSHDLNFNDFLVEWDETRKNIIMVKSQTKNLRLEAILFEEIKILEEKLTDKQQHLASNDCRVM